MHLNILYSCKKCGKELDLFQNGSCNHRYGFKPQEMIEKAYAFEDEMWYSIGLNFLHHYHDAPTNSDGIHEEQLKIFLFQLKDSVSTFGYELILKKIQ